MKLPLVMIVAWVLATAPVVAEPNLRRGTTSRALLNGVDHGKLLEG